jgi:hypothetical protein
MATALVREGVTHDEQVAEALRLPPRQQVVRLAALRQTADQDLRQHQARAMLALARQHGPRNMGPMRHREYNFEAAGRDLGMSGQAVRDFLAAEGLLGS